VLRVRALTAHEAAAITRLAHSRTQAARAVERARIIWLASQGEPVPVLARQLGLTPATVRLWIKRFNEEGVAGLADKPRSGAPPTYSPEQVGEVIAAALTNPADLGLPFGCWTRDRLHA
jgi:transposase